MKPKETVDFHIRWSWHNISRMYNLKASDFGGTMAIGYTLLNIDKDGTPSTKLGPKMGMEPRSLTRMIKSLEENGLIEINQLFHSTARLVGNPLCLRLDEGHLQEIIESI